MKRLGGFGLLLAASAAIAFTPSCESRSLVPIDVQASAAFSTQANRLENVRLTVTANRNLTTRFPPVRLSTTQPYQIGVYLPGDMTGRVTFDVTIDDGACVWGRGSKDAPNVQGGETAALVVVMVEPTGSCEPIGGTGTAGAGGMTGAAGVSGAAGVTGVAGSSAAGGGGAGVSGRGGVTGTAGVGGMTGTAGSGPGVAGRGGVTGTAGMGPGTAGSGPAGTMGTAGIGGMTGGAGRGGSVGTAGIGGMITGTAGIGGMTGLGGRGATTGMAGSGPAGTIGTAGSGPGGRGGTTGMAGNLGTGGTATCICTDPRYVCDLSGACVCAQSTFQACQAAGIQCGYATNNCGDQVFCDCLLANAFCEITTGRCLTTCPTGTGGTITTQEAQIICPDQPVGQ